MSLPLKKVKERHQERMLQENKNNSPFVYGELFKEGVVAGIGWAFGVTVGFVLVSTILVFALRALGGLPLIGGWIANIVEETQGQLIKRTPFVPQ